MGPGASKDAPQSTSASTLPLHPTDADEEDENVKQLNECSKLYLSLQECLARTDRNWKSCQPEVQALKACHTRKNNDREVKVVAP